MPSAGIVALQDQITEFKRTYPDVLCNFVIHKIPEYGTLNDIDIYATYSHHVWNNTEVLFTGSQKFACVCSSSPEMEKVIFSATENYVNFSRERIQIAKPSMVTPSSATSVVGSAGTCRKTASGVAMPTKAKSLTM